MNNYRIEFGFDKSLSIKNSPEIFYNIIKHIKEESKSLYINDIWHFYEPHAEITWLSDSDIRSNILLDKIKDYLTKIGINDFRVKLPIDGKFADWYGKNDRENEFGAQVHKLCSDFVDLYNNYKDDVDKGKGLRKQVERTIHRLCNPLGLGYKEEYKLCFSRGLICLLFTLFSFNKAVWIYKNIFRQNY